MINFFLFALVLIVAVKCSSLILRVASPLIWGLISALTYPLANAVGMMFVGKPMNKASCEHQNTATTLPQATKIVVEEDDQQTSDWSEEIVVPEKFYSQSAIDRKKSLNQQKSLNQHKARKQHKAMPSSKKQIDRPSTAFNGVEVI